MKIDKKTMIRILEDVKPGLSTTKEIIEFSDSFAFVDGSVITFNDTISVRSPIPDCDIEGTVKAAEFFKIINKLAPDKNKELTITSTEAEIVIKGTRASAGVPFDEEGGLPLKEIGGMIKTWKKLPKNFMHACHLSSFCVSEDASLPKLMCLRIKNDSVTSTNRLRIFNHSFGTSIKTEILFPAYYMPILRHYPLIKYHISKNQWIHFKTDAGVIISCRLLPNQGDPYPDVDSFLEMTDGEEINFPKSMDTVLDKADIFCQGDTENDRLITVTVEKKKCIINSATKNIGWFKEIIPNKSDTEVTFEINISFFKDILKLTSACQLITSENSSFLKFEGDDWAHLIMIAEKED